ncbi:hypothetical protein SDC9_137430 [bioreactor metagenome]|uniref:Uncharacterized protein n=1 Tax=bioreactor metagenome TaxID=1076179 RepID=A0A645DLY6_9ZZZZ
MGEDKVLLANEGHSLLDLLHSGHTGGDDERAAGLAQVQQQLGIGKGSRGNLVANRIVLFQEVHRGFIPNRCEPGNAHFFAVTIDLFVLGFAEFGLVTIFQIGDVAPGSLAHLIALLRGNAQFRGTLLELDSIHASVLGRQDQFLGQVQIAIVINAGFGHNISRVAIPQPVITNLYFSFHKN